MHDVGTVPTFKMHNALWASIRKLNKNLHHGLYVVRFICRDSPNIVHFKSRDSHYVVHFKCRDCPYVVNFKCRDCPYALHLRLSLCVHFKSRDCPNIVSDATYVAIIKSMLS